ncbi:P-loop containing nucleoside triphosphate hydrolase protein [Xylaria sp. FL0043]|nr:P-loop containing nucleoside triphosphate hydrolase protein [Xylaria sp. FL0043]
MAANPFATPSKSDAGLSIKQAQEQRAPISSFTFSISDFWKPTEPILQWMRDLPAHARREEPIEPAHYHTLKHSLGSDNSDNDSDVELHRHKRARTRSAAGDRPTVESRRSKLVNSGRGLVRRFSSACQRVVTPHQHHDSSKRRDSCISRRDTPAPAPTPSPGTPSFMLIDRPKMRFVFVGDAGCRKSSVLLRFYRDTFAEHYTPTHYELFHKVVAVDEQDTDIELWDTAGDVTLEQLGRLSYLAWDAVFLCFSVNSMRSFNSARTQWITQIRRYTRDAPLILVGTKTDERVGVSLWAPLYPNLETRVTATEGTITATEIGAIRYVECSAKTSQGIIGVFEEGVRAVFDRREAIEKMEKRNMNHLSGLAEFLCFK